jgi:hypothetical protein
METTAQVVLKYIVHWLVIYCKYMQNAQYTQFQDAQVVV